MAFEAQKIKKTALKTIEADPEFMQVDCNDIFSVMFIIFVNTERMFISFIYNRILVKRLSIYI